MSTAATSLDTLRLRHARPIDRPHLLIWDNPDDKQLGDLAWRENAERVSYRQDLLKRVDPTSRFLGLHYEPERELHAIENLCKNSLQPVVLLEDLDCLITYFHIQPDAPLTLFWRSLLDMKHLECILWILLPSQLKPSDWDERRLIQIE
jgi:hypothetical protein